MHGATSKQMRAQAGLIAGCAFDKDILKAFLEPIKKVISAECRDYVEDITIIAKGTKAQKVVPDFHEQLQKAKNWLTPKNMVLNEKREQLYANNRKFKKEWENIHPDYPGKLVAHCKDLGVCHRSSRVTNHIVVGRTPKCISICKNINTLPVKTDKNTYLASAIVLGGTL